MEEFERSIENSFNLLTGKTTVEEICEKASMQNGSIQDHNFVVFFLEPEIETKDISNEDIDTMIDYFIGTEEYEKCAMLQKLKRWKEY